MRTREAAQAERPGEGIGHRGGVLRGLIQDPANGLRRIPIPRTPVNKAKKAEAATPQYFGLGRLLSVRCKA